MQLTPAARSVRAFFFATFFSALQSLPAAEPAFSDGSGKAVRKKDDRAPAAVSLPDDAFTAMKKFRVAPGLRLDLFASEPLIQNVVSFAFDAQGRVYVVETGRRRTSVFDIRGFREWVDSDLSFRRVDDRVNFLKQHASQDDKYFMEAAGLSKLGGFMDFNKDGRLDWHDLEVETERIRLLTDTTGSGRADKATTFADGFNTLVSGVAAGVLTRNGQVWFTCIPDLWLLQDTKNTGTANIRVNLHHGFGVHIAYGGHDMHGLRFGPDGKIYWSIADRGTHIEENGKVLVDLPDTGAVFRANPDGSELEVVAQGLRNPQELAFDEFGNLFTGDNNADGGDKARIEHIVEGADYGWRYGWQHMARLGPWNSERLWELAPTNTAAYLLPPVAHITHGPAGFAYYPGTGMPARFNRNFVIADFPGGIRHFAMKPRGASFTVDNPGEYLQDNSPEKMDGKLIWNLYPSDVDFGPDGGVYVLDWVQGWEKTGKGRLYRVHDLDADQAPATLDTKKILAEGMAGKSLKEIAALLGHPDQRVRQEAQFTLAESSRRKIWKRGALEIRLSKDEALNTLLEVAQTGTNQLARLHAIWGVGQISRLNPPSGLADLMLLLRDQNPEVRAQCARLVGEGKMFGAFEDLARLLKDPSPRVRFFATMALGKLGSKRAVEPVLEMLRRNHDEDPYLRHAGVMALTWLNDEKAVLAAAKDNSPAVRLAALLVLRRWQRPELAMFLNDPEPALVVEAARAINDVPINPALPQLAAFLEAQPLAELKGDAQTIVLRRAINAQFRLGTPENANALAHFAAREEVPPALRAEALEALGDFPKPSGRDRIVGLWRPLPERAGRPAAAALQGVVSTIFTQAAAGVRIAAIGAIEKLAITEAGPLLFNLVGDLQAGSEVRRTALKALATLKDARLAEALKIAQADSSEGLRQEASRLAGQSGSVSEAAAGLVATLEHGSIGEKQAALQSLGALKGREAERALLQALDQLLAGKLEKELQLDLLEAAGKRTAPAIREKLAKFEAARDPKDDLGKWRESLYGGDARAGKQIFYERAEAGCFRCHKISGEGGDVGPDLTGILAKHDRDYLLASIIYPNKEIAPGFESVMVRMKNGNVYAGILKNETTGELVVSSPEDGLLKLKKADIKSRDKTLSAMPEGMAEVLSKRDLRDLIEFLATAK